MKNNILMLKNKNIYRNNNNAYNKSTDNNLLLKNKPNKQNQAININKTNLTLREYIKAKIFLNNNLEQNRLKQAIKDYKKKSSKNLNNVSFHKNKIYIPSNSPKYQNTNIKNSSYNICKKKMYKNKHSFSNVGLSNNYNIYFSKKTSPIKPFYQKILIKASPRNKNSIIVNDENISLNRNTSNGKGKIITQKTISNSRSYHNKNKSFGYDNINSSPDAISKNNILQKKYYYSNNFNNQKIKNDIIYQTNRNTSFNIHLDKNFISKLTGKETLKTPNLTKFYIYNNNVDKLKFDQRTNNIFVSEKSTLQNDTTNPKIVLKFNKYFNKKNLDDSSKNENYLSKLENDNKKLQKELIQTKLEVNLLQKKIKNLTIENIKINKFPKQDDNKFYKKKIKLRNDRVTSSNTCAVNEIKKIPRPDRTNEVTETFLQNNNINNTYDEDSLSYSFSNENENNNSNNIPNIF